MKENNIRELAKRMGLITVENMCQYTIAQLVYMVANKVNELVDEVWRFETNVQETLKTQNENIQYLLGEGLHLEVGNIFDEWVQDGTFDTLINQTALKKVNERIDETNAQLSDVEANKMDKGGEIIVSQINVNKGKLDQTYMSDEFLQQMAGNTPINAVPSDKSITTIKLGDKSVTPNKTTFLKEENKNLAYYCEFIKGQAVNGNTGELMSTTNYVATDYIEIEPSTQYIFSQGNNLAYYDENKVYISGVSGAWSSGDKIQTTPATAKYMRCTFKDDGKEWIISKGNVLDNTREIVLDNEFEDVIVKTINKDGNKIELGSIEGFNGMVENIARDVLFETSPSYIDSETGLLVKDDSKPNYKGIITYIPVKEKTRYSIDRNYNLAFYDQNKTFISGLNGGWSSPLTTPENTRFIRYTVKITDVTTVMNIGETLMGYDENNVPKITMADERYLKAWKNMLGINETLQSSQKLNGLKWNAMGDSITSTDYSTPNYWQIIGEKYGMIVNDYGFSGTTIAHTHERHLWDKNGNRLDATTIGYVENDASTWSSGCCFCERYTRMSDDADIITFMGGTNDNNVTLGNWGDTDTTTFYGALNTLYKGLINKYPDKIIAVFTPIQSAKCYLTNVANPSAELDKKQPTDTISIQLRAEAIKRKAKQYGIPCLDLFNMSSISGVENRKELMYRPNDNLHPSTLGYEYMAKAIENFLLSLL